ncbi:MAG: hypothetical protein JWM74_4490 [Myxococcaceae bacterium]|nr:hypothetical protein [Myxococcaceae bacterium]
MNTRYVGAFFSCVALVLACGGVDETAMPPAAKPQAVRFDVEGVLAIAPGQIIDVKILTPEPSGQVSVGLEGDYLDGSLSASEVLPVGGLATVSLHAPTSPTTFSMRAKLAGSNDARLDVSVSASGFGTLRIASHYTGRRSATFVVGSVFLKASCPELAQSPLKDGAPKISGPIDTPLVIPSVPAGTRVAVSLRVGHYASGCLDIDALVPGVTRDVAVDVFDRALALDRTNLQAILTMEPEPVDRQAWDAMLDTATAKALGAFADGAPESTLLLDAMQASAPPSGAPDFATSRTQGSYETKTSAWLAAHLPTLRARATTWATAAKPDAFGDLGFHIDPGKSAGLAEITLQTFGLLPANEAGVTTRVPFGWTADAKTTTLDDTVHLSGSVYVSPTALVSHAADRRAAVEVPGAKGVPSALATQIDCAGLATALVGAGVSYPGCASTCTAILCAAGLAEMWTRAHEASATSLEVTQIGLTASARVEVGDDAEPVAFSGAWVGQVSAPGNKTFALKGVAKAAYGTTPPK